MNAKLFSTEVFAVVIFLFSAIAFAGDKDKEDGPLKTERFQTDHGVVVRNTYDGIRHTCVNSNPHSRLSSRSEACTVELWVGGSWEVQTIATARDSSVWRSLPAAVLNGVGAAAVQGVFAVKAAEKLSCGPECGGENNLSLTVVSNNNNNISVPCTGTCRP